MKDFETLATKLATLKTVDTPADASTAIDTVVARLKLESKAEEMMASGPNAAKADEQMLANHKADDDAAAAKLTQSVQSTCNVDIT
jgi:hypothetical protein